MADIRESSVDDAFLERALQAVIRIGLVLLLVGWCLIILRPFVVPVIWGMILAVSTHAGFARLEAFLKGRRGIAAAIYVVIALVVVIVPAALLGGTLADAAAGLASDLKDGSLSIPSPPENVRDWPLIGDTVFRFWELASTDLQAALDRVSPQLKAIGGWFLTFAGSAGLGLVHFIIAIFVSAALLVHAGGAGRVTQEVAGRFVGARGSAYADLARTTIRSVSYGIVGIALLQAILAGLGFLAVGLPGAGLLALLCLIFAIVQVGTFPVMLPVVIYVFSAADTTTAVIFTVWCLLVSVMDNILKPMVLGRGVKVPMLIVFLGAIGGLLSSGVLGLFVGPVVLGLGYTLFIAWLRDAREEAPEVAE